MERFKVGVIILHWNNLQDTLNCLKSVDKLDYDPFLVVVVDNGSASESDIQYIRNTSRVAKIISNEHNLGYSGGNNLGIDYAIQYGCDYLWLLNDDVVVASDSLTHLLKIAQIDSSAGFLGPKILINDNSGRILSFGGILKDGWFPEHRRVGELDDGQYEAITEVDFLSGCALLVRRELIESVGCLDEKYFAYYEETDWCFRAKQAGFKILFVPQAKVWHPDTRLRDRQSPSVVYYMARNGFLFVRKNQLGGKHIIRLLFDNCRTFLSWTIGAKRHGRRSQRRALARALLDFSLGRFGKAED